MDQMDLDLTDQELETVSGGKLEDYEDDWKMMFRKLKDSGWSIEAVMKRYKPHMSSSEESRALITRWIKEVFAE